MKIVAVVLAGGQGSRIGGGKPLLTLGGMTLLDRAWRHARQWSDLVAVAVRDDGQLGRADLPMIFDQPAIEGPLGGLATGLQFAREGDADALLSLPADMPFLPADLGSRLEQALAGQLAAIASSGGRLQPVCGLWRVGAVERLPSYLASGRRSLKGFAEILGSVTVEWQGEDDPFFNINSAEDLAAAERRLRG